MYVCVCVYDTSRCVYSYLSLYEEKLKKQNNPKFDEFMKIDAERFGCSNLLQDFELVKNLVKIAMDVWWNKRKKVSVYKKKDSWQYIQCSYYLSIYLSILFSYLSIYLSQTSYLHIRL